MSNLLSGLFQASGPFLYLNLVLALLAVALIGERSFALAYRYGADAGPFLDEIKKLVQIGNLDRAVKVCGMEQTPLAQVVRAGLSSAPGGEAEVTRSIEAAVLELSPRIWERLGWLWSIANAAMLVGVVGTIVGVVRTYRQLSGVPEAQRQPLLSSGVSTALQPVLFGVLIAVACVLAQRVLAAAGRKRLAAVEGAALQLGALAGRGRGAALEPGA